MKTGIVENSDEPKTYVDWIMDEVTKEQTYTDMERCLAQHVSCMSWRFDLFLRMFGTFKGFDLEEIQEHLGNQLKRFGKYDFYRTKSGQYFVIEGGGYSRWPVMVTDRVWEAFKNKPSVKLVQTASDEPYDTAKKIEAEILVAEEQYDLERQKEEEADSNMQELYGLACIEDTADDFEDEFN